MKSLHAWFPFLRWPRLTPALFRQEWTAGFSVALLMVPQSVAYAALAGMPLVTGLYAALLPALVGVMWGGSTRLSIGPSALTCVLISASLTGLAQPSSAQWVNLAIWLALLAGTLQLLMGVLRYGWLLNLISSPVMMGFTQAAGLLIMASQLPALTGWQADGSFQWTDVGFGAASLAALFLAKKWAPQSPSIMLVVAASAAVSYAMGYAGNGGAVIGALPASLPSLGLPHLLSFEELAFLAGPAILIALVSFLEAASCAKTENQREGTVWQENQDLMGQGLAKIVSGLCGSFATGTSFSRSAINLASGAKTGWAVVGTTSFVLLAVFASPALFHVPRAVLAAVVILAVSSLIQPLAFVKLWRIARIEAMTAGMTFGITLLSTPRIYWGVLAGVLLGLSHFLYTRLHPRIIEVGLHDDGSLRDRHLWHLPPLAPNVFAIRMDAELDFAAASSFEKYITEKLSDQAQIQHVCLFAQPINRIDATGVETLQQLLHYLQRRGTQLHISGIKLPVENALKLAGELGLESHVILYRTDIEALHALRALTIQPSKGSNSGKP
ncbi:MAG: SulP family inorganic anion transporter [Limnohabitans sp.]|nr:SulP family inorganic anion transporter [Limnohabitans sp.]